MKIAFDISDLATNRADGTTRYTHELAMHMPKLNSNNNWDLHAPFSSTAMLSAADNQPNVELILSPFPKYWTQLRFPWALHQHRPDVLFMPIQQLPYVRPGKTRTIAVIHDLAFHAYSQHTTYKDWVLLHAFTAYVARQADSIIAVSQSTANDIERYYGRSKNVHVVHHGVDHAQFHPADEQGKESTWQLLHQKYPRLRRPYLLFVGQIQPRKNIIRLVEAFELLHQHSNDLQLVIAGGHGWRQKPILDRIKNSPARSSILLTGRVADELLPLLYNHAEVFVLPSLYEGFGMPILEAQAAGCPVITSNISSMPEIVGDSAVLIDPNYSESICEGILEVLGNKEAYRHNGITNAKKFTWEKTAAQTLHIIQGK